MPTGSVGAVIWTSVAMFADTDSTCFLRVLKNGNEIGSTGVSLLGGYVNTFSYTAFDSSPSGSNTYAFAVSNNSSGPGGNVPVTINSSSIVVSGAKR